MKSALFRVLAMCVLEQFYKILERMLTEIGIFPIAIASWSKFSLKIGVVPTKSGWLDSLSKYKRKYSINGPTLESTAGE